MNTLNREETKNMKGVDDILLQPIKPMFTEKRLAEYFGFKDSCSIRRLRREGKIPPPDLKLSNKIILWKPETIMHFVESGGVY